MTDHLAERGGGLRLAAPAKLNLSLAVTGRRSNGLHELSGTFVLLELADELRLQRGTARLDVDAPPDDEVPVEPERNLAWRGLLAGLDGAPAQRLVLSKRIPAAAGLGGGSSDAAAAWRLARHSRGLSELPTADGLQLLALIGADVPFFAAQLPAARVSGIGERLAAADVAQLHVVLVIPPFRLSTAAVFAELRPSDWSGNLPTGTEPERNDLLAAARRLRPELDDVLRLVVSAGGRPRLTGSGPALFVLEADAERARSLARRLERGGLRVLLTRLARRAASIERINDEEAVSR